MRLMSGRVVHGSVVVDDLEDPLSEGAVVTVLAPDAEEVRLSEDDKAEIRASIAEIDRGEFISADELFDLLKRQRPTQ